MRILITGGTGLIASPLIEKLLEQKKHVTVLTRDAIKAARILGNQVEYCESLDSLPNLDGYGTVINLAGEPIAGKRWTTRQKERLCDSRWGITWQLANLIKSSKNPPSIFISGSAIGFYGNCGEKILTEKSMPHEEFTHLLCEKWENLALDAQTEKTRVCLLRTGIVLSSKGGALSKMSLPFKYFLGSILGEGNQYISWIHVEDMVNAILFLLENTEASGSFNMTASEPVTNKVFSKALAKALNRPCFFRIPAFVLSTIIGEGATLLIDGQRAVPWKLQTLGYKFTYKDINSALKDIYAQRCK